MKPNGMRRIQAVRRSRMAELPVKIAANITGML